MKSLTRFGLFLKNVASPKLQTDSFSHLRVLAVAPQGHAGVVRLRCFPVHLNMTDILVNDRFTFHFQTCHKEQKKEKSNKVTVVARVEISRAKSDLQRFTL